MWDNWHTVTTAHFYSIVKQRLLDQYIQYWFTHNPCEIIGLKHLKSQYTFSDYLTALNSSLSDLLLQIKA